MRLVTSTLTVWRLSEERGHQRRCRQQPLEVVQHQEETLVAEHAALRRAARHLPFAHAQHRAHRGSDQGGVVQRAQIDEPDAIGEVLQQIGGHLQGQPRLAHPAGTGDGQQPDLLADQHVSQGCQLRSRPISGVSGTGRAAA